MSESKPTSIPATSNEIGRDMRAIQSRMMALALGIDYLIDSGAPEALITRYMEDRNEKLLQAVAKITGGNAADIANKDTRTDEQERLMLELSAQDTLKRFARYWNSDFVQSSRMLIEQYKIKMAQMLLRHYKGSKKQTLEDFTKRVEKTTDRERIALQNIALYYFATHKDIDPQASGSIGEAEKAEMSALLDKALALLEGMSGSPRLALAEAVGQTIGVLTGTKKAAAKATGAITDTYERALSITAKDYQWALTPYPNPTAFIAPFDDAFMAKLAFIDGKLSFLESKAGEAEIKKAAKGRKMELVKDLDIQLLRSLFTAIYHNAQSIKGGNVTVYMPTFCKAMGVDLLLPGKEPAKDINGNEIPIKANDILGKVAQFRNCVGVTKDGSIYALLNFSKYDRENNTITFDSPYMNMIIEQLDESNKRTSSSGETYLNPRYSYLVHSSIGNEKNKAAIEIVHIILALLHQRGGMSDRQLKQINDVKKAKAKGTRIKAAAPASAEPADKTVTAHKKYSEIVHEIPILDERIGRDTANASNVQLKRAFKKAFELLRTKTDAYQYFIDLQIPEITPTITTLDSVLTIKHKGTRTAKEYKPKI